MISQHVAKLGKAVWAKAVCVKAVCLCLCVAGNTATAADCGPKVEAEFQKLRTSGRAYRIETEVAGDQQGRAEIFEFAPPDRMRLKYRFKEAAEWAEFVRLGDRVWDHEKELPGELAKVFDEHTERLGRPLGAFECLGPVKFAGKTYTGYRTYHLQFLVGAVQGAERRAYWRTVLVDRKTGTLAHEIATPEKQLGKPKWWKREPHCLPASLSLRMICQSSVPTARASRGLSSSRVFPEIWPGKPLIDNPYRLPHTGGAGR
jgi:hypothetical protein